MEALAHAHQPGTLAHEHLMTPAPDRVALMHLRQAHERQLGAERTLAAARRPGLRVPRQEAGIEILAATTLPLQVGPILLPPQGHIPHQPPGPRHLRLEPGLTAPRHRGCSTHRPPAASQVVRTMHPRRRWVVRQRPRAQEHMGMVRMAGLVTTKEHPALRACFQRTKKANILKCILRCRFFYLSLFKYRWTVYNAWSVGLFHTLIVAILDIYRADSISCTPCQTSRWIVISCMGLDPYAGRE